MVSMTKLLLHIYRPHSKMLFTHISTVFFFFFFFNDTATTEIYTLSLHDALPISSCSGPPGRGCCSTATTSCITRRTSRRRSEEHTSELQSQSNLVCRLLLEKKKTICKLLITLYIHSCRISRVL